MAGRYVDEEEVWKCPKHPSRRRPTGICHVCLLERLSSLCPDCANARPCPCSSYSSSSASSSSRFSAADPSGVGSVGRVSSLIESEPSFRRSKSLAVPFLRSKPDHDGAKTTSSSSLWSLFKKGGGNKSKREPTTKSSGVVSHDEERRRMMRKSRSVSATSASGGNNTNKGKGQGWHFPSPMKVFKQSISRGLMVYERSPLHRG